MRGLARKGEGDETSMAYVVGMWALLVAVLLVCAVVFLSIFDVMRETDEDARCASQVRAHAAAVRATGELKAPDVVCPSERITLERGDDPKEEIAKQMKRCWDTWGRGELQLFGAEAGRYCHVCSTVAVPGGVSVEGLPEYLRSHDALGDKRSYATYLVANRESGGAYFADKDPPASALPSMAADRPIGIVFHYWKGQTTGDQFYNAVVGDPARNTAIGATAGAVGGVALVVAVAGTGGAAIPVILVAGAAGGAIGGGAGLATGIFGREDLSHISVVAARPLSDEDIRLLGCTYAPVAG